MQPAVSATLPSTAPPRSRVLATLALGVIAVSFAAVFIRLAQGSGASSLAIATGRLVIASLFMIPIALMTCGADLRGLSRVDWLRGSIVGALLAAHFWLWISSLSYVSVALSTVLVTTTPVWVALGAWLIRRERLSWLQCLGLLLAVAGGAALALSAGSSRGANHDALALGCALAIAGAWAIAGNMLIGQGLRAKLPVRAYAALAYGWAGAWLLLALIITKTPVLGLAPNAYWAMLALALVPQLIGHTALNWALPYLGATTVAVSILAEPVGAALIATLVLNEPITLAMVLCFAATLVGIALVAFKR